MKFCCAFGVTKFVVCGIKGENTRFSVKNIITIIIGIIVKLFKSILPCIEIKKSQFENVYSLIFLLFTGEITEINIYTVQNNKRKGLTEVEVDTAINQNNHNTEEEEVMATIAVMKLIASKAMTDITTTIVIETETEFVAEQNQDS